MNIQIGKRKIVQIQLHPASIDSGGNTVNGEFLYALCDDGTVWVQHHDDVVDQVWVQVNTDKITEDEKKS